MAHIRQYKPLKMTDAHLTCRDGPDTPGTRTVPHCVLTNTWLKATNQVF